MGKIEIKGPIISDGNQWIYDYFGMPATSPMKVNNALAKMKDDEEAEIIINSGGGSVFAGSEIYTALRSHKGKTKVSIVGIAASAASVIAMSGDVREISPTAQIMIHRAETYSGGNKDDLQHTADVLDGIDKSIANAYQDKTGIDAKELLDMMSRETWLTAQDAKRLGFVDSIMFETEDSFVNSTDTSGIIPQSVIDKMRNEFKSNIPPEEPKEEPKDEARERAIAIARATMTM